MRGGMKGMIGALVLGGLLVAPELASAQTRGYVGIGGGVNLPIGDFGEFFKLGWLGQVTGGVTLSNGILGFRVDGGYGQNKPEEGEGSLKLIHAFGDVVLTPRMEGKAKPYVLAGAGIVNFKNGDSSTDFAWNAGAGVVIAAGRVGVYVEGRFVQARDKEGDETFTSNMIPITVGVRIGGGN
ncbi:MAG: outer membrane beta-barrel protein [Gemmatimonadales bacterium]